MDSFHSLVSIAINSLLQHQATRLAASPLLLRAQHASHDLFLPSAFEEFIRSNTWHQLRTLPIELTQKFIDKVLLWTYSSDDRISMLLLSLILRDTNFTDLDFAARIAGIRTHRIPAINPNTWQILGFLLPSTIVRINLNHLNVADSFLNALAHSAAAKTVEKLKLRQNMITNDGLRHLSALKSLKTLDVAMIPFSAGACTVISDGCPQLQVLSIGKIGEFAETFLGELNQKLNGKTNLRLPVLRKLELLGDQTGLVKDPSPLVAFLRDRHHILESIFELSDKLWSIISSIPDLRLFDGSEEPGHSSLPSRLKRVPQRAVTPRELGSFWVKSTPNLTQLNIRNDPSAHLKINKKIDYPVLSIDPVILQSRFKSLKQLRLSRVFCKHLGLDNFKHLHSLRIDHIVCDKISLPSTLAVLEVESLRVRTFVAFSAALEAWFEERCFRQLNTLSVGHCTVPWNVLHTFATRISGKVCNVSLSDLSLPDSELRDPTGSISSFTDSESESDEEVAERAKTPINISLRGVISFSISSEREFPRFYFTEPTQLLRALSCSSDLIDSTLAKAWPESSPLTTLNISLRRASIQEPDTESISKIIGKSRNLHSVTLPPTLTWQQPCVLLAPIKLSLRRLQLSGPNVTDAFLGSLINFCVNLTELILGTCRSVTTLDWLSHQKLSEIHARGLECTDLKELIICGSRIPNMHAVDLGFRSARKIIVEDVPKLSCLSLTGVVSKSVSISGCKKLSKVSLLTGESCKVSVNAPALKSLHAKMPQKSSSGKLSLKHSPDTLKEISLEISSPKDTSAIKFLERLSRSDKVRASLQALSVTITVDDDTDDDEDTSFIRDKELWRNWSISMLTALAESQLQEHVWRRFPRLRKIETPLKTLYSSQAV